MAPDARGTRPDEASQAVLELVRTLATELSPRLDVRQVSLDSPLSEELGLDSLGRVELMSRLEHTFGVALPESTLFGAETPRDLVLALAHAPRGAAVALQPAPLPEASAAGFPTQARTLVEALAWHVQAHADRPHLYVLEERGPHVIDYGTLWRNALRAAEGLRARDLIPGQRIGLMLPTSTAYFECFFGILLAGGVPVPIYPPFRPAGLEDHLLRQAGILANAESPLLIAIPEAQRFARLLQARVASLHTVLAPAELQSNASGRPATPTSDDMALVQYTSGSTGRPKGVVLTHANLLANVRAMGRVARVSPEDVFVSWLPLYHDMGLIGAWFGSMYHGIPLVVMPPTAFLARPERWLWAIHQYHATLSAAPNFAYELCARKIPDAAIAGLDLASWRMACNGSEPVSPDTLERFAARFAPSGFRGEALAPVYGLAESAVGLAFTPPGRGPRIDRVRRGPLERAGLAEPAASDDSEAVRLVSCGEPLPGHQIRVVDEAGRELPERHVGRLEFKGPSCTSGYFHAPEQTRRLFHGDWLDSGDMAYVAGADIYLTGRVKDLVKVAGRNLYPYDLEAAIGDLAGVRRGCVAVFGTFAPETGTERIVVVAETRETDAARRAELVRRITGTALAHWDVAPDDVVLTPPHAIPKTSSGKIRRGECRERYERGELTRTPSAWRQRVRLVATSVAPAIAKRRRRLGEDLRAGWAWACFGLLAPPVWTAIALLPSLAARRRLLKTACKRLMALSGVRLRIEGLERLPAGPCVLVCNHASYMDVLLLTVALPEDIRYVAKRSFRSHWLTRLFMERLATLFVARDDPRQGLADTAPLEAALRGGDRLLIFPEGGFVRAPGLQPFRMGAFVVAADTGAPIVPVALWGTRSLLRGESWFPRPGLARMTIGAPIVPTQADWAEALRLRERAYAEILRHCGEPAVAGVPAPTGA